MGGAEVPPRGGERGKGGGGRGLASGRDVLTEKVQMTVGRGERHGGIFGDEGCGETGDAYQPSFFDCCFERRHSRRSEAPVGVCNELG